MQTLSTLLCAFFWVIPPRLNFICRHFGTICLFHLHRQLGVNWINLRIVGVSIREKVWLENLVILHLPAYEDGTDSVPKSRHIKFRRRGITQKKTYNINNTAKVWNKDLWLSNWQWVRLSSEISVSASFIPWMLITILPISEGQERKIWETSDKTVLFFGYGRAFCRKVFNILHCERVFYNQTVS
jgi:hypothetical protein